VALNPSIDETEPCPGVAANFDDWLTFWLHGFDARGRLRIARQPVPLYEYYAEALGAAAPQAQLGREAIVTDVVRYKALSPSGALRRLVRRQLRAAIAHTTSLPLTRELLNRLCISVVVTVGREATRTLGAAYVPGLATAKVTDVHARVFSSGAITIIPAVHSNHYGFNATHVRALGDALRTALAIP
jgi:hypothetical protein